MTNLARNFYGNSRGLFGMDWNLNDSPIYQNTIGPAINDVYSGWGTGLGNATSWFDKLTQGGSGTNVDSKASAPPPPPPPPPPSNKVVPTGNQVLMVGGGLLLAGWLVMKIIRK